MGSKPSGGGSTTQTQKLDPWLKGQISDNLKTIQGLDAYQAYPTNQAFANLTPQMQQQLQTMQQLGGQGAGVLGQGLDTMQGVANYTPQQIGMQGQMNPAQVAAGQVDPNISAGQANLDPFMNPYQSQVVDQTITDMDRARQMAVQRGEDAAIGAGAFGGSRHGIADAETNRAFADRTAAAVGQLNQQGFNTALGAAQNQQGMDMAAQQANLGANQFNVGMDMQGQLANQQAGMAADQFNIGTDLSTQLANQSAGLDASRLNLLGGQGLAGLGQGMLGYGQQAAQYGQDRNQAMADFQFQQAQQQFMDPRILAQMETAAIQGIPFMGTTSTTQPGGSRLGGALGGAMSGAGMGGMLAGMSNGAFGGPMGMAVGGGLGLLGGMFG
jgi:hypothetical protein